MSRVIGFSGSKNIKRSNEATEERLFQGNHMKGIILIVLMAFAFPSFVAACDICGCGVGTSYIGILPDFNKRIIGLRYRYNSIFSHIAPGGNTSYLTTKELYNTMELWGGWNINKKFRVMLALPYSFNEQINQGLRASKNGPGDINVSGQYELLNSRKTLDNHMIVQSLWVGGGIKLATGKYNPNDKSTSNSNANLFQLGTASTDFTANVMYDVRLQDAGINLSATYKRNTVNKYEYRYGNKLSTTAQVYYKIRIDHAVTIAPNGGVQYETAKQDTDHQLTVDISGGRLMMATVGVESAFKKISLGFNWQTPLSQEMAKGIVKANNRFMTHVSFLL
ncbi:MAG TPA: hypothetical protein VM101_02580 [Flavitalea sp.]|nr:hypothetical protein [Flavitalea sp.]